MFEIISWEMLQSGSEIFVLVWHWYYPYSLGWIPVGGSLQLIHEGLLSSGVKAKLSALLVFLFDKKSIFVSEKILKKSL